MMSKAINQVLHPTRINRLRGCAFALLAALIMTGSVGCGGKSAGAAAPPPPDVSIAHPVQKEVIEWDTYAGYLEAPESANVAARVSGMIVQMPFAEGSIVKRGDLLAVIDDRPFK